MKELFNLSGKIAVVTGGTGVLGAQMAKTLARGGAVVGVLGRRADMAGKVVDEIRSSGGKALVLTADVLNEDKLRRAKEVLLSQYGRIDILVNAAGGNLPGATIPPDKSFFDLQKEEFRKVVDLNLLGTVLPTQIFAETMAEQKSGSVINISSTAASRPLTRVVGYAASKSAIDNFTRWMAVELAFKYGDGLRVNAIAPGFFLGEQNKALLVDEGGKLTERGSRIIEHTPMKRFGNPEDLDGALLFLCSEASRFVTGVVLAVDGGFGAYSGI